MSTDRVPVRDNLVDVEPYGAPQLDVPVRLNTNETAEAPPAGYLEEVARRLQSLALHRYPDRDHVDLRAALARRHGVDPSQTWAANGSNEILLQLLQAYAGPRRRVAMFRPSYSMYPELCRTAMSEVVAIDLDDAFQIEPEATIAALVDSGPHVVMIASPNNPVGATVAPEIIVDIHDQTSALIVVDEAYIEFAGPGASVVDRVADLQRLVVVRTFSKAFRLAGLRLGYLVAPDWVVNDVQKVRLPYHLDALKQVAGMVALEQESHFLEHRQRIVAERQRMAAALRGMAGVEVFDSSANFLLIRTSHPDLFGALLKQGVLVRDFSSAPRLAGCTRITVGTREDNDALLAAMKSVIEA
ncbi:MAG: histidinol-phosphate transaminase [Nitriliruptoraceae bacterium]